MNGRPKILLICGAVALLAGGGLVAYGRLAAGPRCVSGDCENGAGRLEYPDGGRYEGRFTGGKFHGEGTFATREGLVFSGRWANGEKVEGVLIETDGGKYSGEYKADRKHGFGRYTWPDGTEYLGEWARGETEGRGTLILPDGTRLVGRYAGGRVVDGAGMLVADDGSKHVGVFRGGKRHGPGRAYDPEGKLIRVGEWVDDHPVERVR